MRSFKRPAAILFATFLLPVTSSGSDTRPSFLKTFCVSCHHTDEPSGDFDLDPVISNRGNTDAESLIMILDVLKGGSMPPEDEPQPKPAERTAAIQTLQAMLQTSAAHPGRGNLIDHKALFTEPKVRRAATPSRLWRLSPHIFKQYANDLTRSRFMNTDGGREGGNGLHPAFAYMTPAAAFRDDAAQHVFEEATTELLFDVCLQVAELQVGDDGKGMKPQEIRAFLGAEEPTPQQWVDVIKLQFKIAVRREPDKEELSKLVTLGQMTLQSLRAAETEPVEPERNAKGQILPPRTMTTALKTVLAAVMLRPDAVYRYEVGRGEPDQHGRIRLSDYEVADAISFALTDAGPDEAMRAAIQSGELSSNDAVLKQVKRLLDAESSKERLVRFFQEYFEYPRVVEVFKDDSHPNYTRPDQRIMDADQLISHIVNEDHDVLKRLLTEDKVFVVYGGGERSPFFAQMMTEYYMPDFGFPSDYDWKGNDGKLVQPTIGRRSGILTHPVWLLTFSDNEKNQAIQRGHWIYSKLLGGHIPDTPIGVDAVLPTDPHLTLREKMKVTRDEYCWRCHSRMDPLGLPLEQFDDFGAWRDKEIDRPVVTTGEINIGDPQLDGPVKDPYEMLQRMAHSLRVEQVFTRHVFRYFMGRNETVDDAPTLIDAHKAYRESGGSFKALVASLLTSDSFLLRRR
ncbi:DUF1588 domain-containing protein [Rubripirellula tenax]|nr:DUF1588 domain-containing protein [Rubripirellula tenax]